VPYEISINTICNISELIYWLHHILKTPAGDIAKVSTNPLVNLQSCLHKAVNCTLLLLQFL
jgi:hypothetical protein